MALINTFVYFSIKSLIFITTVIYAYNSASGTPVMSRSGSGSFMGIPVYFESIPLQIISPQYDLMNQILTIMMTNMAIANQNNQTSIPNASMTVRIFNFTGVNTTSGNGFMIPSRVPMQSPGNMMPVSTNSTRQFIRSVVFPGNMNFSMMAMGSVD